MRYADLHTHTYHSDGTRSPREVIDVARAHGIEIVCISDHDNLAAYFEIKTYADAQGVTLVPGTELPCAYDGARIVPKLLGAGIDSVEVFHPQVDDAAREAYSNMARFRGKMLTGGSDDHGTVKTSETLGTVRVPEELIRPILDRL